MAILSFPDDILYIVFAMVDADSGSKGIEALPIPRRHPLASFAYVCKQWKRVVDELLHQSVDVLTVNGLLRLAGHIRSCQRSGLCLGLSNTRRLAIRIPSFYASSPSAESLVLGELHNVLCSPMSLVEAVLWLEPFRGICLAALFDASGSTLRELELWTVSSNLDLQTLRKLSSLSRLERLAIRFANSWEPVSASEPPQYMEGEVQLCSLKAVKVVIDDAWPCGFHWIFRALYCAVLAEVVLHSAIKCEAAQEIEAFESFFSRHGRTLLHLTLDVKLRDISTYIVPLKSLRHLELIHWPSSSLASVLPETLESFKTVFPDPEEMGILQSDWWRLFAQLAISPPSHLRTIQAREDVREGWDTWGWTAAWGTWKWKAVESMVDEETKRSLKALAVAFRHKGIEMLDLHGRSHSGTSAAS